MDGDIAKLGFEVDSSQLKRANEELQRMPKAGRAAESATGRFKRAMDGATSAANRFYHNLEKVATRTGNFIGNNLRQIALGFAAIFGAGALIQKIGAIANALDEVSKAARATNSATEDMQALATAGELAGLGADYIASASRRMNRVLGTAVAQGKGATGVFKQLGISAKELSAMPVDDRFAAIADRMREMNLDAAQSTAILAALGDRGGQLINLLGEGGDQIRKAAEDVTKFNLAISDTEGLAIEEMNDNWTRLGYAVTGAFTQFIAFIAPTVGALLLSMANGIAFLVSNIGALEPVIAIVGPMLMAFVGPAIIQGVLFLAKAIAVNLAGAFIFLGKIMLAHPLMALAALLVGSIAAIWHFRDEISKAIGVDVEAIFKDAANLIIRVLLTAFETIKDIWNNFPTVIGSAVIGAVNWVINGVNQMIDNAVIGINRLGAALAGSGIPGLGHIGVGLMGVGTMGLEEIPDPWADKNAASAEAYQKTLATIWSTDYAGQIGDQMTKLSEATTVATTATNEFNTAATDSGGAAKAMADSMKTIQDAAEAAQAKFDELRDTIKDVVGGAFKSFFTDIKNGKSAIDALNNSLGNMADKLMDMVLNNVLNGLIGAALGGMGGGLGVGMGLTGAATYGFTGNGVYGVPGLAKGGVLSNGAVAIAGEAGPEAVLPLARGPGGNLGVMSHGNDNGAAAGFGAAMTVNIYNNASNDNEVRAEVASDGSLEIYIDKMVAGAVANTGSKTNRAITQRFGLRNATKSR